MENGEKNAKETGHGEDSVSVRGEVKVREVGFSFDAFLVYSPEKELEVLAKLAEKGDLVDWKPAIVLAAAYLEKAGIDKLKNTFEPRKINPQEKLEKLRFHEVTLFLYGLWVIDEKVYDWMNRIWKERVKIIHQKEIQPNYIGKEANKTYGEMMAKALEILKFLKS